MAKDKDKKEKPKEDSTTASSNVDETRLPDGSRPSTSRQSGR